MLVTVVSRLMNRAATTAVVPAIWHATVRNNRLAVAVEVVVVVTEVTVMAVPAAVVAVVIVVACHATIATRVGIFHVIVRMAPSHATAAESWDTSVENVLKMVAEIKFSPPLTQKQ